MPLSIAIIGAGPAGLTLARLLQVSGINVSVTIFERDASPKARHYQGGTLDLHPDTGLAALRKAGLFDVAFKNLRYEGEELVIADKNATEFVHMKEQPKIANNKFARPEIDREVLKDILLESVESSWITWAKILQSVEESTGVLTFRDGSTAGPFDLIVGADGAWSKVRHLLTDVRPQYAGLCGFEGLIRYPSRDYPHISKQIGRGSYFAFSDKKGLMIQRMGDDSLKVGAWLSKEEHYPADVIATYGSDEQRLRQKILEHYQDWAPEMREWIEVSTNFRPWDLYELPVGHTWEHKKGYTLIGDAASLMTPFAGEGVNKAMKDCLELAEALEEALQSEGGDVDQAVQKYERSMFPRAKFWQEGTMQNKMTMFSEQAPTEFLAAMVVIVFREIGVDLSKGLWWFLPVKFTARRFFGFIQWIGSWRRSFREWRRR